MSQITIKLKCVGCQRSDTRSAEECRGDDMPICKICYMPMIPVVVTYKPKKQVGKRAKRA